MGKKAHRPKDKYYTLAKEQGFRARSAFKLIQLNRKYDFLGRSQVLIDLCAAPGGWLQVAAKYMPVSSMIIGVDLMPIRAIRNVITHVEDITTNKCRNTLKRDMGKHKADVVLHDGAPNVGAAWIKDAFGQSELVLHSLKLASEFLRRDGWFITKVFRSTDYNSLLWVFQQFFRKVEATKPHSSRTASAEIFVVCQGYLAPDKIDPKMLDPEYVFKRLDGAKKTVDVLHSKNKAKKNRDGYADDVGVVLHRKESVATFIEAEDPVRVLSECNQLIFDERAAEYKAHAATTTEVIACCDDLKVLGKKDFRGLLKWRGLIKRDQRAAAAAIEAAKKAEEDAAVPEMSPEEKAALDEAKVDMELHELADQARLRRKREKKKARAAQAKQLQKVAMGMTGQAVELLQDRALFSLSTIKSKKQLDAAAEVDLGGDDGRVASLAAAGQLEKAESSDSSDSEELDTDEERDLYQQRLEDEASFSFDTRQSRAAKRALEAADSTGGRKLTRKQRAIEEAKIKEAQAMDKLDHAHQRYLKLLSKAGKRKDDSDDETSDSDDDDGFSDDPDDSDDGPNPLIGKLKRATTEPTEDDADAAADRWFSQKLFQDAEEDALAQRVAAKRAGASKYDSSDDDGSDDDSSDDDSSDSSDEEGAASIVPEPVVEAPKKKTRRSRKKKKEAEAEAAAGSGPVELEPLPMTEREKLRVKRKKALAKKEARAARKRRRDEDFEVVGAGDEASDVELGSDGEELTEAQKEERAARRELIRAGMGRALGDDVGDGEFEVVAAPDSDAEDDGRPDLRQDAYDSDTHAELLALGKKMRKHTTAKALVDASYNRYSFNDDYLPKWFAEDEKRHFRPQLPITKAEVDAIKRNFRDIAARPVHKVAEARARKKRRLMMNLEKARAKASNIAKSEDMGSRSKAKAIQSLYTKAQLKRADNVYVVMRNGHKVAVTGGATKGGKVKMVDARLRSDTNAQKRAENRKRGKGKGKGKGRRSKGRRRR